MLLVGTPHDLICSALKMALAVLAYAMDQITAKGCGGGWDRSQGQTVTGSVAKYVVSECGRCVQ
jgi:hypothetical protein